MKKLNLDNKHDLALMFSKLLPEYEGPSDSFRVLSDVERIFVDYNLKDRIIERSKEFSLSKLSKSINKISESSDGTEETLFLNLSDFLNYDEDVDIYGTIELRKYDNKVLNDIMLELDLPEDGYTVYAALLLIVDSYNLANKKVPIYFGSFNLREDDLENMEFFEDIYSEFMMFIHEEEI